MKRNMFLVISAVTMMLSLLALKAFADPDIDQHRDCAHCGMDRKLYGYSRMLVMYEDTVQVGVCSLHCAVTELNAHKGKMVKSLLVADRDKRTLIEAHKASWVIGGTKRGVMTQRPKWAFATQTAAQAFAESYGGKISSWEEALAAAQEDAAPKSR